jgi:hypothetical protein
MNGVIEAPPCSPVIHLTGFRAQQLVREQLCRWGIYLMSFNLVDLCFDVPGLALSEHAVLAAICRFANNITHSCYPSRALIAKVSRLSPRQVQRIIPILIARGYLSRTAGGKGRAVKAHYKVDAEYLRQLCKGDTAPPLDELQGDNATPKDSVASDLQGDILTPYQDPLRATLTPFLGDIGDTSKETPCPRQGDIGGPLYRVIKKESGKENQSQRAIMGASVREFVAGFSQAMQQDVGVLALEIAIRHPRSRLRRWTARDVDQVDVEAILLAMRVEAERDGVSLMAAGEQLLEALKAWDDVPEDRWRFVPPIVRFYADGDYRVAPGLLPGVTPEGRNGKQCGQGNDAVIQEFLGDGVLKERGDREVPGAAGDGLRPPTDRANGGELRGGSGGVDPAGDNFGIHSGNGRMQIFPIASAPARILWPRK